jgi:serine/threonine protein kinase
MEKYNLQYLYTDGKNSVTGLCTSKKTGEKYIFKHSGAFSSVVCHEYRVLKRLGQLKLPYFPKVHEYFHLEDSCSDLLIMEFIDGKTLESFPSSEKKKICMILLLIVEYTRILTEFVHYDLHSSNVLVKTVPRTKYTFSIKNRIFSIDNYGYLPVIIDFGCSYIDTLKGESVSFRLDNLGDGCMFIPDPKVDMLRISLMSGFLSDEMIDYLFPDSERTFNLPSKFHRVIETVMRNTPLDDVIPVTYRCIEILVRLVIYPFRKILKITSMRKEEFRPLCHKLEKVSKNDRKALLYRIVHRYINHNLSESKLKNSLKTIANFLSTICNNLLKENIRVLNSVYKKYRVKTPLELYEFLLDRDVTA